MSPFINGCLPQQLITSNGNFKPDRMVHLVRSTQTLTVVVFWIWMHVLVEPRKTAIVVSVIKVRKYGVEIDWHLKTGQPVSWDKLSNCELVYGPIKNTQQVQVLPYNPVSSRSSNHIKEHMLELNQLLPQVTYHFHMICYDIHGLKFYSNKINFTTGVKKRSKAISKKDWLKRRKKPSYNYNGPNEIVNEEDSNRPNTPSSNVILGAVCGIVGFLIINITVVMAVRKYSHRQLRRRHMLGLEDRDYDGFQYLQDVE